MLIVTIKSNWKDTVKHFGQIISALDKQEWAIKVGRPGNAIIKKGNIEHDLRAYTIGGAKFSLIGANFYIEFGSDFNEQILKDYGIQIKGTVKINPQFEIIENLDEIKFVNNMS